MLTLLDQTRRRFLQLGAIGLGGLSLPTMLQAEAQQPRSSARAKACILLYMDGGASHLDMWDLKPDAPAEVRGPYAPQQTSASGVQISELLPLTARQMHRVALVRSMRHEQMVHDPAVYQMLTGVKHISSAGDLKVHESDAPHIGSAFGWADRAAAVMPRVIQLPESMKMDGRVLPGQNAGYLGRTWDPLAINVSTDGVVVPLSLDARDEIPLGRLAERSSLWSQLNAKLSETSESPQTRNFHRFQQQALAMLERSSIKEAFDLERESTNTRDRYGRHRHGQSTLLARRLVEAGARFVTVYWGRESQDWADGKGLRPANNPWDTHRNHFPILKESLAPRADQTLSALLEDLSQRGMLDETLVVWTGEFGRTPRISKPWASRDHWPHAFTTLLAGAGIPGGAIHGATDRLGAEVTDAPVSPADLTATILDQLGIDPQHSLPNFAGKPAPLSTGKPISWTG